MVPTSSVTGDDNPADFTPPTSSTILWILVGVFVAVLAALTIMCFVCNQRGAFARRSQLERRQSQVRKQYDTQQQVDVAVPSNNSGAVSTAEMAMITLSRNGIPKRHFSLPETRALQTAAEAAADVAACDPFISANSGRTSFPVRRGYERSFPDEISLADGDSVVLTRVFRDGWAEGVSMRAGGPALFPLACLGGGVPIVLAERLRIAQMARLSALPTMPGGPVMIPGPPPPLPPVKE
ncbi:hypothetical protein HDU83_005854 [Entophlyctis luteolus]|nr:hypothetical protein HDU83_005854 [Entophlyctis luteolus]